MKRTTRIAWSTATAWVSSLTAGLLAFMVVPLLIGQLGKEGYGLISVVTSIISITMLSDLGIRYALNRHLAAELALGNTARVNELLSSALVAYLVLAAVPVGLCVFGAEWIVGFIPMDAALRPAAVHLLRYFASVTILLTFIAPAYQAILFGVNRAYLHDASHLVEVVLRFVLVCLFVVLWQRGHAGWAAGLLAAQVVSLLLNWRQAHRVWPGLRASPWAFRWSAFGELFTLGSALLLNQLAYALGRRTDPLVVAAFLGATASGVYANAVLIFTAASPFVLALGRQMPMLAAGFHATGAADNLREVLISSTRYTFLMAVPVCAILAAFAQPLVDVWLGTDPTFDATAAVMWVWAVVELSELAGHGQWSVLLGMNRVRPVVTLRVVLAVLNLGASIGLVWWLTRSGWGMLGIVGAALPTAVLSLTQRAWIVVYTCRQVGIGVGEFVRRAYGRGLVVLVVLSLVAWPLAQLAAGGGLPRLLGLMAVPSLLWFPLCWWVAFDGVDRRRLLRVVQGTCDRFGIRLRVASSDG